MTGPPGSRQPSPHAQQGGGPPRKRPPGPPVKRPPGPGSRPPGPPGKRPAGPPGRPPAGAPGRRPAGPPGKRPAGPPPRSKRAKPKKPEKPYGSGKRFSPPVIVFAVAFVVILLLVLVTIAIGPPPRGEIELFPGGAFDMGLVASFLIWPIVAFWGAKRKKAPVAWAATIAYLGVTLVFGYFQLLVFGGLPMIIGAVWLTSR